jgi:hypothetical protein
MVLSERSESKGIVSPRVLNYSAEGLAHEYASRSHTDQPEMRGK